MRKRSILIIGAGGHGSVVADAVRMTGRWDKIAFIDDRFPGLTSMGECPVIGMISDLDHLSSDWSNCFVAIGSNYARTELFERIRSHDLHMATIVHPSAQIAEDVLIGEGVVVLANAVINTGSVVGNACIVNTSATVDHDNRIGDGVHISPGVNLGGGVIVKERAWIGIGATVVNNCCIGRDVIVGAGAVVIDHVGDGLTVVGIPAREIKK